MSSRAAVAVLGLAAASLAAGCEAERPQEVTTGAGATTGALTISGHLRDPAGNAIVGGRIELDGDAFAVRRSDFTGGFAFHVDPGSYRLAVSGECSFASPSSILGRVTASTTADFDAAGRGCMAAAAPTLNP